MSEWKNHLFSCIEAPLACCWSLCVPCGMSCMQGTTAYITTKQSSSCIIACLYSILCLCLGTAINRRNIRNYFIINGSFLSDLCLVYFCPCCAIVQEWRETMLHSGLDQDMFIIKALTSSNKA